MQALQEEQSVVDTAKICIYGYLIIEELINHDGVLTKGDVYDAWPEVRTRSVSGYDPGPVLEIVIQKVREETAWGGMPELGRMEFHEFNPDDLPKLEWPELD